MASCLFVTLGKKLSLDQATKGLFNANLSDTFMDIKNKSPRQLTNLNPDSLQSTDALQSTDPA